MIVPARSPSNVDYHASTLGSATKCSIVTDLCDIYPVISTEGTSTTDKNTYNDTYFNCTMEKAGFVLEDTFSDAIPIINANIPTPGLDIVWYTDATKSTTYDNAPNNSATWWFAMPFAIENRYIPNGNTFNGVMNSTNITMYTGQPSGTGARKRTPTRKVEVMSPFGLSDGEQTLDSTPIVPVAGLVPDFNSTDLDIGGILLCNTILSDVVRRASGGPSRIINA